MVLEKAKWRAEWCAAKSKSREVLAAWVKRASFVIPLDLPPVDTR